ncbi:AMP-dependent synthetase/ligase [Luteococcus japonicus]|uniref:Acyl-CoA synthetase n=1 Tax=Luteococcus japonicus LSP_Lj1 TaxID=1255658 RepID=A0A1R4KDB8_9ACTN|nr:long-chain fatty acid--CoA ligase [Luteococcus japonicus]SJN42185.1 Acetyl-coenzyme A synthetase [Luteococcus japonicus LSP_Lj1]
MEHLAHMFRSVVAEHGSRPATRIRQGEQWVVQTYAELDQKIRRTARALVAAGVEPGDRVSIFAHNCPEWTQVDFACMTIGAIPTPIYATSTPEQIKHIINDSGARLIFASGESEASRCLDVLDEMPSVLQVVSFDEIQLDGTSTLSAFDATGDGPARRQELEAEVERRMAEVVGPDDLCAIIYTSGTTGAPKGVMLRHRNLIAQNHALSLYLPVTPEDHSLCFLPLSHALERGFSMFTISRGCMNTYVPDAKQVADLLVLAKPTMLASVPKLFETVYATAHAKVANDPSRKKIFEWAMRVGGQCQRAYRKGKEPNLYWRAQLPLADKLVLSSIREAMGGNKKFMACGGAPFRVEVAEFFSAAGLLVIEGFGMTEASPLISFNRPDNFKFGTCGPVMEGGELKIGAESEILFRGPTVMKGYWNNPEATAAAIDEDGWLHTGDGGYVDNDGYLVINDRLKDIIVTLNGKNIAPQPIEGLLLADPLFEHAVLLGDNRPCLTLLVKPSLPHLAEIAEKRGISYTSPTELLENSEVAEEVRQRVAVLTEKLPSHEQIRDLRVLFEDFTMDNGLLTPTLKVKRREVEKRFGEVIDDMYAKIAERRRGSGHGQ